MFVKIGSTESKCLVDYGEEFSTCIVTELRLIFANVTCAKVQYFHGGIFKHQNKAVIINLLLSLVLHFEPIWSLESFMQRISIMSS